MLRTDANTCAVSYATNSATTRWLQCWQFFFPLPRTANRVLGRKNYKRFPDRKKCTAYGSSTKSFAAAELEVLRLSKSGAKKEGGPSCVTSGNLAGVSARRPRKASGGQPSVNRLRRAKENCITSFDVGERGAKRRQRSGLQALLEYAARPSAQNSSRLTAQ